MVVMSAFAALVFVTYRYDKRRRAAAEAAVATVTEAAPAAPGSITPVSAHSFSPVCAELFTQTPSMEGLLPGEIEMNVEL